MIETFVVALATLFATVGPLDVVGVYAGLTTRLTPKQRRRVALRGTGIATLILFTFALLGEMLLAALGISLAALRTGGGILLLLIGIDMVFARHSGSTSTTAEEEREALSRTDISVFPVATPLIAGPGALGAVILLMADAEGEFLHQSMVLVALFIVLMITLVLLLLTGKFHRLLGRTGMQVVERVFGMLLASLAVQFIFDGIAQSGLLSA